MPITPGAGYSVDPSNPNGVVKTTDLSPTTPAQVPTTAPAVSASNPAASPVAVVSAQKATDYHNNVVIPAYLGAQTDLQRHNAFMAAGVNDTIAPATKYDSKTSTYSPTGKDIFGNPVAYGTPTTEQAPTTAEEQIANTPDSGNKWIYDAQGNRTQVAVNESLPAGYYSTNPVAAPTLGVLATSQDSSGNSYKQYSDGSFGRFDAAGKYVGTATQQDFSNAKNAQEALDSLNQLAHGTYPLNSSQQAQVDGLKAQFAQLIKAQETANANFTGGTTVAQNLYGMGNSVIGLGAIKGTVDDGIAKIADLNSKMVSAVANMTNAFNTENHTLLKDAYDAYTSAAKEKQANLDKIQAATTAAAKDQRDFNYRAAQDDVTNKLKSDELDFNKKKEVFDQAMQSSDLDLKQKKQVQDMWAQREDLELKRQQVGIQQAELKLKQQQAVGGSDLLNGGTQTTVTGKQYVDSSQYKGSEYNNARAAAAAAGIPFVGKDSAETLTEVDKARLNQNLINDYVHQFLPQDATGRIIAGPTNKLSQFVQSNDQISAFGSFRTSAIGTLKALAGTKGLRINEAEIILALQNDLPEITDTLGTADQKLKNINDQLDNVENSILIRDRSTLSNGGGVQIQDPKTGEIRTFPKGTDTSAAEASGYKVISR